MSFVQGEQNSNNTASNYMMYAANTNDIISQGVMPTGLHFSSSTTLYSASLRDDLLIPFSGSIYNPTGSLANLKTEGYQLGFRVELNANNYAPTIINYAIQKSINGGSSWSDLSTTQTNYVNTTSSNMFYRDTNATTSSLYRVAATAIKSSNYRVDSNGNYIYVGNAMPVYLNNTSYFQVLQYPNPGVGECRAPFWTTGSSANILLASTASVYGLNNYRTNKQKDIENSGFKPINLDFEPQAYDEIRFQGLEQLSFIITNVTESNNKQMILNLDQEIPNGVNLDYFFLRRYVDDPSSILLNVNYPIPDNSGSSNSTGNGILKPQYVTDEVNTIIQNTLTQNLI
jgi:hypothetical protein